MSEHLVIGVDAGGTSTRAQLRTVGGTVLGTATGGGANPNSHPPELAARRIADTVTAALGDTDPSLVRAAVLGLAGDSKLVDPAVAALFDAAWRGTGIPAALTVLSDAEVAFASATTAADGTALIAGTGSIAVAVEAHRKVRVVGGYGWLLGDEGSGYWIGREAVRTTLDQLTAGTLSELGRAVFTTAVGTPGDLTRSRARVSELITAANAEPPVRLARFAPLVSEAAGTDPVAAGILDVAVDHLCGFATAARGGGSGPVVLTGGLIGTGGPLTERLRGRLTEVTGAPVLPATDGAAGAAWLAGLLLTR